MISAEISTVISNKTFEKPLNPILGETYQARGQDGSHIYLEQISHHPPISYMSVEHEDYKVTGSMEWVIRAGLQSAEVEYIGTRTITFKDGGCIEMNFPKDKIYGLFIGTFGHQMVGKQAFRDVENDLSAEVQFGAYMFKKQDYVWGEIKQADKKVCEITGNYVGHLDFDEVRYWDYREIESVHYPICSLAEPYLPSDSRNRTDAQYLISRPVEEAQAEKERLEDI